jgi:hypothetical protein
MSKHSLQIVDPKTPATRHGITYLERAFDNPAVIVTDAMHALNGVQFDTLIGTGLSGCLVVPTLARALGRHFAIVRKPNDGAHSPSCIAGEVGSKWLFVDEQICSGTTFRRVHDVMSRLPCEFVGSFIYGWSDWESGFFLPPDSYQTTRRL